MLDPDDVEDLEDAPETEVEEVEAQVLDQATAARTIDELEAEIGVLGHLESLAREASELLGREVPTGLDRRGYLGDLEAQAVCGLLGYRRHLRNVLEDVAPGLAEVLGREPYGPAAARIAAAAYSSGPGAVVPLLDALPRLADEPQAKWAPLLGEFVALHPGEKIDARGRSVKVRGKWRAAFLVLRWEHRMCGAVELGRLVLGGERATLAQVEELAALEAEGAKAEVDAARQETQGRAPLAGEAAEGAPNA